MANLKDIKNRVVSVKNTQQITKAMQVVSAAKLKKQQTRLENNRPYSKKIEEILYQISVNEQAKESIFFHNKNKKKRLYVIVTSDKGLCGALNTNICKYAYNIYQQKNYDTSNTEFYILGKKGKDFFSRKDVNIKKFYADLKEKELFAAINELSKDIVEKYLSLEYTSVYIFYNNFRSALAQIPTYKQVLPIISKKEVPTLEESYIFEPQQHQLLQEIVPAYVNNLCLYSLLENLTSEHSSRMQAMDSATRNARDLIDKLQLQYNRARQANITTELTEIISGAETLQ